MNPTPHDIAQLAWTRHEDPLLALRIATASGQQSDAEKAGKPQTLAQVGRR